jgi:hypothetical protein
LNHEVRVSPQVQDSRSVHGRDPAVRPLQWRRPSLGYGSLYTASPSRQCAATMPPPSGGVAMGLQSFAFSLMNNAAGLPNSLRLGSEAVVLFNNDAALLEQWVGGNGP